MCVNVGLDKKFWPWLLEICGKQVRKLASVGK